METGIQEILGAEQEANAILARAKEDAERIVGGARQSSVISVTEHEARLRKEREDRISDAAARLEEEQRALLAKSEKEIASLMQAARKRLSPAVELIISNVKGEE